MTPTFDRRRIPGSPCSPISSWPGPGGGPGRRPGGAAPAGAHARVSGSDPADGSDVEGVPEARVDQLQRQARHARGRSPTRLRLDRPAHRRRRRAPSRAGRRCRWASLPGAAGPTGQYEVVYRVVSADTHVVAGRLGFTVTAPAAAGTTGWMRLVQPQQHHRLRAVDGPDRRFDLAAATVAVALVAVPAACRHGGQPLRAVVWRRPRPT